jgi:hypothetical protein
MMLGLKLKQLLLMKDPLVLHMLMLMKDPV